MSGTKGKDARLAKMATIRGRSKELATMKTRAGILVALALLVSLSEKVEAQSVQLNRGRLIVPQKAPVSGYVFGKFAFNYPGSYDGYDMILFEVGSRDGVRVGDILPVRRRSVAGEPLICEVKVTSVEDATMYAASPKQTVTFGDEVIVQSSNPISRADAFDFRSKYAEMTFKIPGGLNKSTYFGKVQKIEWAGPLDMSFVHVQMLVNKSLVSARYPASAFTQVRVNGMLFVPDEVKGTIVYADVMPIRDKIRSDERQIQELRLAQINADERVRIAETRARYDLRQAKLDAFEARERASYAEQELENWKRQAMNAAKNERSGESSAMGRVFKFASGALSATAGAVAIYNGEGSFESGASLVGGASSMWDAVSGK